MTPGEMSAVTTGKEIPPDVDTLLASLVLCLAGERRLQIGHLGVPCIRTTSVNILRSLR